MAVLRLRPARTVRALSGLALVLCALFPGHHALDGAQFAGSTTASHDSFGFGVCMSGDYLLVGAPTDDDQASKAGAVFAFRWESSAYVEKNTVVFGSGSTNENFGNACAMDGDYAIVGARGTNSNAGAAHILRTADSGATWQHHLALPTTGITFGDYFGFSVGISGNYAIVGAYGHDTPHSHGGIARIFVTSDNWATTPSEVTLTPTTHATSMFFGRSVSISGDYAAVGANGAGVGGQAFVFKTVDGGASWTQKAMVELAAPVAGDNFGGSISLDATANPMRLAVGAHRRNSLAGSVGVFQSSDAGENWSSGLELTASDSAGEDWFGAALDLDGDRIVVGAYPHPDGADAGKAYGFETSDGGTTWSEESFTYSGVSNSDQLGYSVTTDGDKVVAGTGSGNYAVVWEPATGDLGAGGGGGDPVIVDLHGHRFLGGKKPLTEYLLWASGSGAEKISFTTSQVDGLENGYFIHSIKIVREGCGSAAVVVDDDACMTHTTIAGACINELVAQGDNGLVLYSAGSTGTSFFIYPHHSNGFSFLNTKFLGMTEEFKAGCGGMICDEKHADLEITLQVE